MVAKNEIDNPRFVDEETIPLVQEEDYDDYNTPDTSRIDETSITEPDTTEATSTIQLRQKKSKIKLSHCTDTWMWQVSQALLIKIDLWSKKQQAAMTFFFSMVNIDNPLPINVLVSF